MLKQPAALQRLFKPQAGPAWGTHWSPPALELNLEPEMPKDVSHGIALVGAGFVVHLGHLPAYRKAGFNVIGVYDVSAVAAREAAEIYDIQKVYRAYDELLEDETVKVVDIALPPQQNFAVVERALSAGKHVLVQKPMAMTLAEARALVDLAEKQGAKLAVAQNARWDDAVRGAHRLIERGLVGEPVIGSIDMRFRMRWSAYLREPTHQQLILHNQNVHHFDNFRFWFGEPETVSCTTSRYPGQPEPGENIAIATLRYANGLLCTLISDGFSWADDHYDCFRIEGLEGIVKGCIGWQRRVPSSFSFISQHYPRYWFHPVINRCWYPDSFLGPMSDLLCAIESDREPATSGRDNIKTLQIVFAAYRAAEEGRAVAPNDL